LIHRPAEPGMIPLLVSYYASKSVKGFDLYMCLRKKH